MKKLISVAAIGTLMASPALADWSGLYAGGAVSKMDGKTQSSDFGVEVGPEFDMDGEALSVFAGYNFTATNWVYGAEIAYSTGKNFILNSVTDEPLESAAGRYYTDNFIDLKARAGYDFGRSMVYGVLGYSMGDYSRNDGTDRETLNVDGISYGTGVDFIVSENFFLGGEILFRDMDHDESTLQPGRTGEINTQSISIRAGYKF
jgi:hypothetical protein